MMAAIREMFLVVYRGTPATSRDRNRTATLTGINNSVGKKQPTRAFPRRVNVDAGSSCMQSMACRHSELPFAHSEACGSRWIAQKGAEPASRHQPVTCNHNVQVAVTHPEGKKQLRCIEDEGVDPAHQKTAAGMCVKATLKSAAPQKWTSLCTAKSS